MSAIRIRPVAAVLVGLAILAGGLRRVAFAIGSGRRGFTIGQRERRGDPVSGRAEQPGAVPAGH